MHKMTLLHIISKYHDTDFTDEEKLMIKKLIGMSNNLLLRNNFGKTIIQVGRSPNNSQFLLEEITKQIEMKMRGMAFIVN